MVAFSVIEFGMRLAGLSTILQDLTRAAHCILYLSISLSDFCSFILFPHLFVVFFLTLRSCREWPEICSKRAPNQKGGAELLCCQKLPAPKTILHSCAIQLYTYPPKNRAGGREDYIAKEIDERYRKLKPVTCSNSGYCIRDARREVL